MRETALRPYLKPWCNKTFLLSPWLSLGLTEVPPFSQYILGWGATCLSTVVALTRAERYLVWPRSKIFFQRHWGCGLTWSKGVSVAMMSKTMTGYRRKSTRLAVLGVTCITIVTIPSLGCCAIHVLCPLWNMMYRSNLYKGAWWDPSKLPWSFLPSPSRKRVWEPYFRWARLGR